uniref:Ig-like domain-containing protein n=1 Tax=Scophthalmus maximus TaxID=52904 RepID=A0A8D3E5S1_SCOMX
TGWLKMICPLLLTLNFLVHGLVPGSGGNRVNQPSSLLVERGQSALMDCTHDLGGSYLQMCWYQLLPGSGRMKLIVTTVPFSSQPDFEDPSQGDKFAAAKNEAETGSFAVTDVDAGDDGVYFCAVSKHTAHFGGGTRLTVLGKKLPPVVKVLGPSSRECRNLKDNERRKTLLCVASDFYPDHVSVSWRVGGQEVSRGVATDNAALRQGENYKITSRLRVSAEDWFKPETEFECIVSFFDGTGNTNHSASIFGGKGLSRGT